MPSSPTKAVATRSRTSLFKSLFDVLPLDAIPRLRPRNRRRDTSEGLIAPRSPSAQPPSPGFGPMPSLNGLPSPLLSPRRVSSDSYRPGSPSGFHLDPPPRRSMTKDESSRDGLGPGLGARRLDMRRTVSAQSSTSEGWREF